MGSNTPRQPISPYYVNGGFSGLIPAFSGSALCTRPAALVIDDFFSLSVESAGDFAGCPPEVLSQRLLGAEATKRVLKAQEAYASEGVAGSPAKDVRRALTYQFAGAFVDSTIPSVKEGQVLVGAPPEKRFSLSFLSLKAAALPGISRELAAALAGSWTSALLFRKPLAACLCSFFKLGLGHVSGQPGSDVVPLSRAQAQELVLLAALAPIAVSNVALPHCTDASLAKGAKPFGPTRAERVTKPCSLGAATTRTKEARGEASAP